MFDPLITAAAKLAVTAPDPSGSLSSSFVYCNLDSVDQLYSEKQLGLLDRSPLGAFRG